MTQSELIRKLQTFTPNTPYAALLGKEFGVNVPSSSPKYQAEYLYKYCLSLSTQNVPNDQLINQASIKALELFEEFPWVKSKHDKPEQKETNQCVVKTGVVADGTIIFDPKVKSGHQWQCYYNGKVVAKRKCQVKLKAFMQRKFDIQEFFGGVK